MFHDVIDGDFCHFPRLYGSTSNIYYWNFVTFSVLANVHHAYSRLNRSSHFRPHFFVMLRVPQYLFATRMLADLQLKLSIKRFLYIFSRGNALRYQRVPERGKQKKCSNLGLTKIFHRTSNERQVLLSLKGFRGGISVLFGKDAKE